MASGVCTAQARTSRGVHLQLDHCSGLRRLSVNDMDDDPVEALIPAAGCNARIHRHRPVGIHCAHQAIHDGRPVEGAEVRRLIGPRRVDRVERRAIGDHALPVADRYHHQDAAGTVHHAGREIDDGTAHRPDSSVRTMMAPHSSHLTTSSAAISRIRLRSEALSCNWQAPHRPWRSRPAPTPDRSRTFS